MQQHALVGFGHLEQPVETFAQRSVYVANSVKSLQLEKVVTEVRTARNSNCAVSPVAPYYLKGVAAGARHGRSASTGSATFASGRMLLCYKSVRSAVAVTRRRCHVKGG